MLKNKKILIFILVIISLISILQNTVLATNINVADWDPATGDPPLDDVSKKIIGTILGIITSIGSVASILFLVIIGIRFMLGSVEEKAQYKEALKPYLLGAFMVFGILQIVNVLYKIGVGLIV